MTEDPDLFKDTLTPKGIVKMKSFEMKFLEFGLEGLVNRCGGR